MPMKCYSSPRGSKSQNELLGKTLTVLSMARSLLLLVCLVFQPPQGYCEQ